MKEKILILALIFSISAFAQKKILFLGNSYTAVNNLPNLLYQMALADGETIIFDSYTPGGYTLQQHSNDVTALAKINSQAWDVVVLQEQSQLPSFPPFQVITDVLPFAKKLDSLIHVNNPCTQTVFYMTWGRKYGDQGNCANYPPLCTYAGMQERLRESYLLMADENHARVSPVGIAFQNSIAADTTLDLYVSDFSHPSVAGSYLAACTFYASIFKRNPVGNTFLSGLSGTTAAFLQNIAAHTVLDSLSTWKIGVYEPNADFSFTQNGLTASFTSENVYSSSHSWSFGSTLYNPDFTFPTAGDFSITHIACDACRCDTLTKTIHINSIGIEENVLDPFLKIYPNPSNEYVMIALLTNTISHSLKLNLISMDGKQLYNSVLPENSHLKIDLRKFKKGNYLLRFEDVSGRICTKKISLE